MERLTLSTDHAAGGVRQRNLEDTLCQVHTDRRSIHVGLLLIQVMGVSCRGDSPPQNREESRPSFGADGGRYDHDPPQLNAGR